MEGVLLAVLWPVAWWYMLALVITLTTILARVWLLSGRAVAANGQGPEKTSDPVSP